MALDPTVRNSVARPALGGALLAGIALGVACRPTVRPDQADDEPAPVARPVKRPAASPGRQALLGEMCPLGAAGRPGLSPLVVRDVSWSSERDDVVTPLARGNAAEFTVLAVDGRKAGVFSAIGTADVGGIDAAVGSYAGAPPCSRVEGQDTRGDDVCLKAARGCGLAVASLGAAGGGFAEVAAPAIPVGGACRTGDALAVDIDGDGVPEVFPLAAFVDPVRAPADEVSAAAMVAPACKPTYTLFGLIPPADPTAPAVDAKHKVELDLLGVLDVDGDGRQEIVVAFRYVESRTIAVYSAIDLATRLELVGEVAPWP